MVCMGGGGLWQRCPFARLSQNNNIFFLNLKIPNSAGILKSSQILPHLRGFLLFPIYHGLGQKVRQLSISKTSTRGNLYLCQM